MKQYTKLYIDGEWVDPIRSRSTFELVNPATEQAFASVTLGDDQDVDRAVQAARQAFPAFSATTKAERIALLNRIAEVMQRREADLMLAASQEMGTPVSAVSHARAAVEQFKQGAAVLADYEFERMLGTDVIRREPIGVCGLISPWNWPIQTICTKLSSAIAAGCTVVVKPSEYTSVSAILITEVLHEAELPRGVFNLVNGDGAVVGNALSTHSDVDMVSFTGSTRAGILVAQAAAATVKRVCQELGGKSAHIIMPDADLHAAARFTIARGYANSGQSCHAPTRILVHESQSEQVLDLMSTEARKLVVGDPKEPATNLGPVVNKAQFDRIQGYIRKGIEEGARLICGGPGRPAGLERGYYVRPTVFADVRPDMTIAREEIFGPVLAVISYRTIDEAVEIANATKYGLGGYVFASTPEKARAVGERLRAGRIFCNGAGGNVVVPMGGYKQSGNGREMGVFGLEEYLEVKAMIGCA
ncbi:3-succinoylsemialdehyde-pyridine dehydrogenase [Cupriavidus yeoncheonensis]|uniref:3-succinoylsemialdehyde-pyridine dehydrogenase n=1 Tax=Cupriavidus yeoncheonensis TaxID=1462994 RepID=A0A916IWX6_9BURK|nr:aldehyde dehydrogenase family protein [Cupriavidus yeoncheonensis]CAG2153599.1 3-succinoylsemialdehyde-pyridine dehydrogenase [Cupriavidus yeoncheonensis]